MKETLWRGWLQQQWDGCHVPEGLFQTVLINCWYGFTGRLSVGFGLLACFRCFKKISPYHYYVMHAVCWSYSWKNGSGSYYPCLHLPFLSGQIVIPLCKLDYNVCYKCSPKVSTATWGTSRALQPALCLWGSSQVVGMAGTECGETLNLCRL